MIYLLLSLFSFLAAAAGQCFADEDQTPAVRTASGTQDKLSIMDLSVEQRCWYRNKTNPGSCVQCSIGMIGVHCNDIKAATVLFDTQYGPAIEGGSWPKRVEEYCDKRGIIAWSVTGATVDETIPWCIWASKTGRFAAVGCGTAHFQTLYGFDPGTREFYVCNNNSPDRIDRYTEQKFRELHAASGPWLVILQKPSSPPPKMLKWWREES